MLVAAWHNGNNSRHINELALHRAWSVLRWVTVSQVFHLGTFICRGCSNPVISTGHTSVDIGASANLEVVDKFCYLVDMLSVDGDADAAVEARIRTGWNKFRQLVPV